MSAMNPLRSLCLCWLLVVSLHAGAAPQTSADVSYAGTLPCADCAGQEMLLTLFADGSFRLRTRYLGVPPGRQDAFFDLGRWGRDEAGRLVLRGGREAPMRFAPVRGGALRLLDRQGRRIKSALNYTLQRQSEVDLLGGPFRLRGLYKYLADAALLTECRSGRRWPVLIEGQHLALERAYLAHRAQGGSEWVLVGLSGEFVQREPEPGLPPREFIRVEAFERLWPRETCAEDAPGTATLLNTLWRLVEIDGQSVMLAPGQPEPRLQLSIEGDRVRGQTGCHTLSGRFEHGGDRLVFKGLGLTGKDCLGPAGVQEARFIAALRDTAHRRIIGDALHLRDATGAVRLRFEALYLR